MSSIIDDLVDPSALPDKTTKVSVVQTHISIVFIGDQFVYKVKKPVNFGFLDFSTLEKRKYYCQQELELNRRLSKDIYLDVLPVTMEGVRYTLLGKGGEAVDYAVKIKRIPDEKLMKEVFSKGDLTKGHLEQLADVLGEFHLNAHQSPEIDFYGKADSFRINTNENFDQVDSYIGKTIQHQVYNDIKSWTNTFYQNHQNLFEERIKAKKIRDCHGDLHMEHICFTDDLAIIDCIEFNERFRYSDTVADIAFILMDLEFNGGFDYARSLWNAYKKRTSEKGIDDLLKFYKVYRAFVRGKVNSFQIDDPNITNQAKEKASAISSRYFELAHSYI